MMKELVCSLFLCLFPQLSWTQSKHEVRDLLRKDSINPLIDKYGEMEAIKKLMYYAEHDFDPKKDAWYNLAIVDSNFYFTVNSRACVSLRMKAFYWMWLIYNRQTNQVRVGNYGELFNKSDSVVEYDLAESRARPQFFNQMENRVILEAHKAWVEHLQKTKLESLRFSGISPLHELNYFWKIVRPFDEDWFPSKKKKDN